MKKEETEIPKYNLLEGKRNFADGLREGSAVIVWLRARATCDCLRAAVSVKFLSELSIIAFLNHILADDCN